MIKICKILMLMLLVQTTAFAKDYTLSSPDKRIVIKVEVSKILSWSVSKGQEVLLNASPMSLTLGSSTLPGKSPVVVKAETSGVTEMITAIIPVRNKLIPNNYTALKLVLKGGCTVEFRAYNEGVAYRFITELGDQKVEVNNEEVSFNFNENDTIYLPNESNPELQSHYEADFLKMNLADISKETYGYLPLYIATKAGTKMVITESDLHDYPNLFLYGTGGNSLTGRFPKVILESRPKENSDRAEVILKKAAYHARTSGNRSYPWRVMMISDDDKSLLENELVYQLAAPNVLKDTKWIKPGKVAWDWWNDNNIYGVNFKSGLNTDTYKYYVDFASEYGLEYIILDEGWSRSTTDLLAPNPDIELKNLIDYAAKKM